MQLYDPTVAGPERNYVRAAALDSLEGKTIGVLENSKLNAADMLHEIAALFEPVFSKKNASAPAPGETLQAVAKDVDFLITGLGD